MPQGVSTEFTNMCMITDGDKVLVQNRTDPHWPGMSFPGGHVEEDESFIESVIREVWEETGLTIANPVLCGLKDWQKPDGGRYVVLFFKANRFSGALRSSSEGDVMWVRRSELHRYPLSRDFANMLRVFEEDGLSEFYYRQMSDGWAMELY